MKTYIKIIVYIIFTCMILSSCEFKGDFTYSDTVNNSIDEPVLHETISDEEILEETEYYKIIRSNGLYYSYFFNSHHQLVKIDGPLQKIPEIVLTDDGFIRFAIQAGTGIGTQYGYYYDMNRNIFSEVFQSIYDQNNCKVAYGEHDKVIVRNIFDKTKYYKEISVFDKAFSKVAKPIINAEFSSDGKSITIKYLTGPDYREVSENFAI